MERKAGSQLTAQENWSYEIDSFLRQIFISSSLCMPSFGPGAREGMVNRHGPWSQAVWGVTCPVMFNINHLHPLRPRSSAKSPLLANALEMSLREKMGEHTVLSLGWNETKPEAPPRAVHVVHMCWQARQGIWDPFLWSKSTSICLWKMTAPPLQIV